METVFRLMAAIMASAQRAYTSAPLMWAGQRSTTCCRFTEGSSWNLDTSGHFQPLREAEWVCGLQGAPHSLSQDGLENLQLRLRFLAEPDKHQLIQPEEHTR